jgi:hypothetical protein
MFAIKISIVRTNRENYMLFVNSIRRAYSICNNSEIEQFHTIFDISMFPRVSQFEIDDKTRDGGKMSEDNTMKEIDIETVICVLGWMMGRNC